MMRLDYSEERKKRRGDEGETNDDRELERGKGRGEGPEKRKRPPAQKEKGGFSPFLAIPLSSPAPRRVTKTELRRALEPRCTPFTNHQRSHAGLPPVATTDTTVSPAPEPPRIRPQQTDKQARGRGGKTREARRAFLSLLLSRPLGYPMRWAR